MAIETGQYRIITQKKEEWHDAPNDLPDQQGPDRAGGPADPHGHGLPRGGSQLLQARLPLPHHRLPRGLYSVIERYIAVDIEKLSVLKINYNLWDIKRSEILKR